MYILSYPWVLVLLLLPLVVAKFAPPYQEQQPAIRTPWFARLQRVLNLSPAPGAVLRHQNRGEIILSWLLWFLVILALARPQFLEPPVHNIIPTRDLLLVVDLSGSMETKDFTNTHKEAVSRLQAVKEVLDTFLRGRQGDRVGLIVFGNAPFVQIPFTPDLEVCRMLLAETAVRMAGPRTAFGDAIGLGITLFARSELEQRVMIALTDGNDTGSKVPPEEAARIARDQGITLHVVGVGNPEAAGEEQLDEAALRRVATTTGGSYFHAGNRDALAAIYRELDRVETREEQSESYRPKRDLFVYPLSLFALLLLLFYAGKLIPRR